MALQTRIAQLERNAVSGTNALQQRVLDPAVHRQFQKLQSELKEANERYKECRDDLEAREFTSQSIVGKKLIAKCRVLLEENEELGREVSEGRIHQLECELLLQKELADEMKRQLNGMLSMSMSMSMSMDRMNRD